MGYLSSHSLNILRTSPGKYTVQNYSKVQSVLERFWNFVASFIPISISANFITLTSIFPLIPVLGASYLLPPPLPFRYQLAAVGAIFFFQTMDGVDGIHARRCRTMSPLGDLLDHVLDQICALSCVIISAASMGLGHTPFTLVIVNLCALMAFGVHWETTFTRVLIFENGSSIIEAQLGMMLVNLLGPVYGSHNVWSVNVFAKTPDWLLFRGFSALEARYALGILLMGIPVPAVVKAFVRVYRLHGSRCFMQAMPMILMFFVSVLWATSPVLSEEFGIMVIEIVTCCHCWFCVAFTLLERLTSQPLPWYGTLHILTPGIVLPLLVPSVSRSTLHTVSVVYAGFSLVTYFAFFVHILSAFSTALGLPILAQPKSVKQRPTLIENDPTQ